MADGIESLLTVSLLIPVYNVERYLRQCLESAAAQTLHDIEVICINDGSTDGSRMIIEEYLSDDRFRVIDKPNSGYGASMNRGLHEARGKYIAILESDDFLDSNALEELVSLADANEADVVKADFYLHWSEPSLRDVRFGFVSPSMTGRVLKAVDDPRVLYRKPSIWSALYRADYLRRNEIWFLETPGASYQDASFAFKSFACADRIVLTESAYLHYRQDNETSSVNSPGKVYCVCDEYAEMERFLEDRHDLDARYSSILQRMKFNSYMWNYERLAPNLQKEFLHYMADDFGRRMKAGDYDLQAFEPWKRIEIERIVNDPNAYHNMRLRCAKLGGLGRVLHLLLMGGPAMLVHIFKWRRQDAR